MRAFNTAKGVVLVAVLSLVLGMAVDASSAEKKLTMSGSDEQVSVAIKKISEAAGVAIIAADEAILAEKKTYKFANKDVEDALKCVLSGVSYALVYEEGAEGEPMSIVIVPTTQATAAEKQLALNAAIAVQTPQSTVAEAQYSQPPPPSPVVNAAPPSPAVMPAVAAEAVRENEVQGHHPPSMPFRPKTADKGK